MGTEAAPAGAMVVSLLTDYGLEDGFVGALHSVLRRARPHVPIVDLSHAIARQDVRAGSLALVRAAPYLAPGVVVAIVDPGVGTSRRGVAVETVGGDGLFFVGPDNGLLPPALDSLGGVAGCVQLEDRGYWLPASGPTFAGRDVFAPAAAQLAGGASLRDLGRAITPESLVRLPAPLLARSEEGGWRAEVTWVDKFGNVQLAAELKDLEDSAGSSSALRASQGGGAEGADEDAARAVWQVGVGGKSFTARLARVFADLEPGELGLLADSYGHLALVLNGANAADLLGAKEGEVLALRQFGPAGTTGLAGLPEL